MTDSMKFGPEWLRNMSNDNLNNSSSAMNNNSSYSHNNNSSGGGGGGNNNTGNSGGNNSNIITSSTSSTSLAPRQLAEFRYGREEMLLLYDKNMKAPEILPSYKKLYVEKLQCPLALTPSTEDETPIPVSIQQRPWSLRSPVGFSGSPSIRGTGRGVSIGRGERGKSRGSFLHTNIGSYQRPTAVYDLNTGGVGERSWPERNGAANNDINSSEWNGSPSSSPRKEFVQGGGMSGGNSHPPLGMGLSGRSSSNYMDNWRRQRMDEENSTAPVEGWRGHMMTSSCINNSSGNSIGTSYRWGRSTSWREDDNSTGSAACMQRSFSNTVTTGLDHRNCLGSHNSGSFSNHHHHSYLGQNNSSSGNSSLNSNKHNSIGSSNSTGNSVQWNNNSEQEDLLPEWATENPTDSGGSFDATGAFHGSNDEDEENRSSGDSNASIGAENCNTNSVHKREKKITSEVHSSEGNESTIKNDSNVNNNGNQKISNSASDSSSSSSKNLNDNKTRKKESGFSNNLSGESTCNSFSVSPITDNKNEINKLKLKESDLNSKKPIENIDKNDSTRNVISDNNSKESKATDNEKNDTIISNIEISNSSKIKNTNVETDNSASELGKSGKLSSINEFSNKNQNRGENNFSSEISDRMQEVDDMVAKLITDDDTTTSKKQQQSNKKTSSPTNSNSIQIQQPQQQPQQHQQKPQISHQSSSLSNNTLGNQVLPQQIIPPPSAQQPSHLLTSQPTSSVTSSNDWYYRDPQGKVQGPFTATEMAEWYRAGYFDENLFVRRACDIRYAALGELVKLCGNGMPFLSSHLIPPLTDITPTPSHPQQQAHAQKHQSLSNAPPLSQHSSISSTVQQQAGGLNTGTVGNKNTSINSTVLGAGPNPQNNLNVGNNHNNTPEQILLMQQLYYLQKQFYLKHRAAILSQLTQSEPWNMLSRDQQQILLNQQMSQIAYPEYLNSLQALSQSLNVMSPISYNLHQMLAAGKQEINQTKVNPNWFNSSNNGNLPTISNSSANDNSKTNEFGTSGFNFHNLMHQQQQQNVSNSGTTASSNSHSNQIGNHQTSNSGGTGGANNDQNDPIKSLLIQLQMQKAVAAASSNVSVMNNMNQWPTAAAAAAVNLVQQHHLPQQHHQQPTPPTWATAISGNQNSINNSMATPAQLSSQNKPQISMWDFGALSSMQQQPQLGKPEMKTEKQIIEEQMQQQHQHLQQHLHQQNQHHKLQQHHQQQQAHNLQQKTMQDEIDKLFKRALATTPVQPFKQEQSVLQHEQAKHSLKQQQQRQQPTEVQAQSQQTSQMQKTSQQQLQQSSQHHQQQQQQQQETQQQQKQQKQQQQKTQKQQPKVQIPEEQLANQINSSQSQASQQNLTANSIYSSNHNNITSNRKDISTDKSNKKENEEKMSTSNPKQQQSSQQLQVKDNEEPFRKANSKNSGKKDNKKQVQSQNSEDDRKREVTDDKRKQKEDKKQRHQLEDERKRQQQIEEEKRREILDEEKRQKDIDLNRRRAIFEAYQQVTESKQQKSQRVAGSSIAPWSNTGLPGLTTPGPNLAEIQKAERERRAEEQRLEQILESQRKLQQVEFMASKENAQVKWNATPVAVKSLTEIQAEEAKRLAAEQNSSEQQRRKDLEISSSQNNSINPFSGIWNTRTTPNSAWNGNSAASIVAAGTNNINNNNNSNNNNSNNSNINNSNTITKTWGSTNNNNNNNVSIGSSSGFWEESPKTGTNNQITAASILVAGLQTNNINNKNNNQQLRTGLSKSQTISSMQTIRKDQQQQQQTLTSASSSAAIIKSQPNINHNINNNNNNNKTSTIKSGGNNSDLSNNKNKKIKDSASNGNNNININNNINNINNNNNNNNNSNNGNKKDDARDEFTSWCVKSLMAFSSGLDVPTFISFLQDIESPFEVKDYIRLYLGETKECIDFAKQFLERRSRYKNQQRAQNAHIDDMCVPAPAVNPSSNDFQEVKGKGKKIKKNKMTKLDARILGFSVTAAQDRINVGDRDYGDTS